MPMKKRVCLFLYTVLNWLFWKVFMLRFFFQRIRCVRCCSLHEKGLLCFSSEYYLIFLWCKALTLPTVLRNRISKYLPGCHFPLRISSSGRPCCRWLYSFEESFFTRSSKSLYQVCDVCSICKAAAIITLGTCVPSLFAERFSFQWLYPVFLAGNAAPVTSYWGLLSDLLPMDSPLSFW